VPVQLREPEMEPGVAERFPPSVEAGSYAIDERPLDIKEDCTIHFCAPRPNYGPIREL
jgi:hypothetical protein